MQYINQEVLKILSRVKDLLPLERKMRENRNVVVPGSGNGKGFSRAVTRPWKPMPSIRKFEIHLAVHDWLLLLFGLTRRYESATTLYGWKNGKANIYIDYMFRRVKAQIRRKEYTEARDSMWTLMNSHAYQVCCLNYVLRGWYKTMELRKVLAVLRKVKKLAKDRSTDIKFKRVYLQEPTKWRPLGVPALEWRVYLHMYNNLITLWRLQFEDGHQHAYLPGRGVITAWEDLFERIHVEPNIYEADYSGFFNNVTHYGLKGVLLNELHIPFTECHWIIRLNESLVKLTAEDKIVEDERQYQVDKYGNPNPQADPALDPREISAEVYIEYALNPGLYDTIWDAVKAFKTGEIPSAPKTFSRGMPMPTVSSRSMARHINRAMTPKRKGVPQGAPTSCTLATLLLKYLVSAGRRIIAYADDVIYFPDSINGDPGKDLHYPGFGLLINEKKSHMTKVKGEWIRDHIKFLGFKYYPETYHDTIWEAMGYYIWMILFLDLIFLGFPLFSGLYSYLVYKQRYERHKARFMAATRNGASLEFGDKESLIMYLNTARTLLLNASVKQELNGPKLEKFIFDNYIKFLRLGNPVALIFEKLTHRKFGIGMLVNKSTGRSIMTEEAYNRLPVESRISLRMSGFYIREWLVPHIPLTGWFMSRMQSNSWDSFVEQDFRLKASKGSWVNICWASYSRQWGLIGRNILTTFTASSFACHDLLMWPSKGRSGPARFSSTPRKSKRVFVLTSRAK